MADTATTNPVAPVVTDTVKYYTDHIKLIESLNKKKADIVLGQKLYALIYSKKMLADPMVALMMFQEKLLPAKQEISNDNQCMLSHRMDMTTDLTAILNTAESLFNKGATLTTQDADRLAIVLLFLTSIPYAEDLNKEVVSHIQSSMENLSKVLACDGLGRNDVSQWAARLMAQVPFLFTTANNPDDPNNKDSVQSIKKAYENLNQATGMTTSSSKMLQNDAQTEAANFKVQLGGYSKMADFQTSFEKAVNRGLGRLSLGKSR